MEALKEAVAHRNSGMGASDAVAKAAESADFNEKQTERLVEMYNTAAALTQEKDAEDPAGACELASKDDVLRALLGGCSEKKASAGMTDYSFYNADPSRTNLTIEARSCGRSAMVKAASSGEEAVPDELKVSQRSLYKIISGQIDLLKSAAGAADDVARNLRLDIDRESVKIAKAIESPFADPELADMFKAACHSVKAVKNISEYSTKVAESDGGRFAKMHVFDSGKVDMLLKSAENIERNIDSVSEYERKRDFYMTKASEAEGEMLSAVGLKVQEKKESLADMFHGVPKQASINEPKDDPGADARLCSRIASLLKESGADSKAIADMVEELEKDASVGLSIPAASISIGSAHEDMAKSPGIDSERKRIMNVRRAIILSDLMANDPIIRDADPSVVTEAYKTMVMSSPRVSLDKAQVRAFLRSAVNSVAISPADAKVITDVDKGMSLSNIDGLTLRDSSIKDSNQ